MVSMQHHVIAIALSWSIMIIGAMSAFVKLQSGQFPLTLNLTRNGFTVSIRDDNRTDYVIFRIHRNFDIYSDSIVVSQPTEGLWIYDNINGRPEKGDILFVWLGVQSGTLNYYRHDDILIEEKTSYRTDDMCAPTETVVRNGHVCKGQLIFEDNFNDGTELNETIWQREIRMPHDTEDAEFVVFDDNPENCFVKNGSLHIIPTLWKNDDPGTDIRTGILELGRRCTGLHLQKECERKPNGLIQNVLPPVVSARIRTKYFFSFKYGRVDIRAKIAHGDWLLPLMLLEPLDHIYGNRGFASGQVRIAFARGNENLVNEAGEEIGGGTLYGGVVLTRGDILRDLSLLPFETLGGLFSDDFHIFSLIWESTSMTFTCDGLPYAVIDGDFHEIYKKHVSYATSWQNGNKMAPFDQLFYLTLGVSAGGHSDFPDNSQTGPESSRLKKPWRNNDPKASYNFWKDRNSWKSTWSGEGMQVDYVRVYAL